MSHSSKRTLIPEPMITGRSEPNTRTERFFKKNQFKLPQIHSPCGSCEVSNRSKYNKKNSSHSNLNYIDTSRSSIYNGSVGSNRPGSLNSADDSSLFKDASAKRYHSTGQVYPSMENNNNNMWPLKSSDKFTEGYLKMQGLMNAKKDDIIKKNVFTKKAPQHKRAFHKQLPSLPSYHNSSDSPSSSESFSRTDSARIDDLDNSTEYTPHLIVRFKFYLQNNICHNKIYLNK